jgi:WD40 repeat protein
LAGQRYHRRVPCLNDTQVALLLDGRLNAGEQTGALAHLDSCAECRELIGDVASSQHGPAPRRLTLSLGERYVLGQLLGAGAMGIVWQARDTRLNRDVALKLLLRHPGDGDAELAEAQLLAEAHALARLAHPNVISVFDVGTHEGQVFIAMELGRETLASWLRTTPRPWKETLRLVRQAGEGLAAAHATGIVHRDVKPANVLIGIDERARVTDFGLARAADVGLAPPDDACLDLSTVTRTGGLVGTPAYMALEQLMGRQADERSDQFSFCVMAFEALTGARPFAATTLSVLREKVGAEEVRRDAAVRLPRWLRQILLRGLRADPEARWRDMRALLDAIDRGPPLTRPRVVVGSIIAVAATVAAVIGAFSLSRAIHARRAAEAQRNDLIVLQARALLETDPTAALAWLKRLPPDAENWRAAVPIAVDADSWGVAAHVLRRPGADAPVLVAAPDGRRFAVGGARPAIGDLDGHLVPLPGEDDLQALAWSPDGASLAGGRGDGSVVVFAVTSVVAPARRLGAHAGQVRGLAFDHASQRLASTGNDGAVRLWDLVNGNSRLVGDAGRRCSSIVFSAGDERVATGCYDSLAIVWPLAGGAPIRLKSVSVMPSVAGFSRDGKALIVGGRKGGERLPLDGAPAKHFYLRGSMQMPNLSPDSAVLLSAGVDRQTRLWDVEHDMQLGLWLGCDTSIASLALMPDGRAFVSGESDGTLRVWHVQPQGRILRWLDVQADLVAVSRDSTRLATGSSDGHATIWTRDGAPLLTMSAGAGDIEELRFTADGQLLTIDDNGTLMLHGLTGSRVLEAHGIGPVRTGLALTDTLVAWVDAAALHLRTLTPGGGFDFDRPVSAGKVVFADGGKELVFGSGDSLWSCVLPRCNEPTRWPVRWGGVLEVSSDGRTIVAWGIDRQLHRFDSGGESRGAIVYERKPDLLTVSADGRFVAVADRDGTVRLWDPARGTMQRVWQHELDVDALAFSPDGTALVSASHDDTVRVLDLTSGDGRILRGQFNVFDAAILPDASAIVSVGQDRTLHWWPLHGPAQRISARADLDAWLAARTSAIIDADARPTSPVDSH